MDLELGNKLVIVTGAARGIGAAIADGFAAEGARLLAVDVDPAVEAVAKRTGGGFLVVDLTDGAAPVRVAEAAAALGGADVLVNNAGISRPAPLDATPDETWNAVLDINLSVLFRLTRALWAQLSARDGAIVNLASFASKRSTLFGNNASYVAAKHGVAGLTRAAAFEGARQGVRVNAIAPGVVETELLRGAHDAESRKRIMSHIPQNRFAAPEEIANLALFLASKRAAHICGEVVNINGGMLMD